ncbi:hypothetical protein [Kiloniella sp. b19]|uniref:hypothetical protein n=1 Tax=Kiloniella sp. GXU_MW_B19 TaxID=3141326 RepID=UPI0031D6BF3A
MEQLVRQSVEQRWKLEPGAKDARDFIVRMTIHLTRTGQVAQVDIQDGARFNRDAFFRAAAERARAAVFAAAPFAQLKPEYYDDWKTINLTFDPSNLF